MRVLDRCYVVEDPAANSVMGSANSIRGAVRVILNSHGSASSSSA